MLPGTPTRSFLAHTFAWTVFILYELSIIFYTSGYRLAHGWEYAGYYVLNILLFYCNAHVVLTTAFRIKGRFYLLLLLIPLELGLYILLELGLEHFYNLFRTTPAHVELNQRFVFGYIWRGFYFIGLSTTYWVVRRIIRNTRKISQLEVQQLEAQREKAELEKNLATSHNAYLQAQINPHFLFNTLNFIFNQVQEGAPNASDSVLLLSEVMRHALTGVQQDGKTALTEEIANLERYISLNRLRFRYPLHLAFQMEGEATGYRIPPLILLTFVENMFKHGDLTDPGHPGAVVLRCEATWLYVTTRNKKRLYAAVNGFGIGVRNVSTRLQRLYDRQDYTLEIKEDDLYYTLHFKIKLL